MSAQSEQLCHNLLKKLCEKISIALLAERIDLSTLMEKVAVVRDNAHPISSPNPFAQGVYFSYSLVSPCVRWQYLYPDHEQDLKALHAC